MSHFARQTATCYPEFSVLVPGRQLAIDRDLGAVHVQYHPLQRLDGFRLGDQLSVDRSQACEVPFSR
jgi:hypothetical protein